MLAIVLERREMLCSKLILHRLQLTNMLMHGFAFGAHNVVVPRRKVGRQRSSLLLVHRSLCRSLLDLKVGLNVKEIAINGHDVADDA